MGRATCVIMVDGEVAGGARLPPVSSMIDVPARLDVADTRP
jgi:hypothetical protein